MGILRLRQGVSQGVKVTSQEDCRAVQWPHEVPENDSAQGLLEGRADRVSSIGDEC